MRFLTEDALLVCDHQSGFVNIVPTQKLVTIDDRRVLVDPNPQARPIEHCPWAGPGMKPCTTTLVVVAGYSGLLSIDGQRVCLDTVTGPTDSTPPFNYTVRLPGQQLVTTEL